MKVHYVKLGFLALIFICLYSNVNEGHAEVVWSDDFEDGDTEGWNIAQGNFSVEDGTLRSTVEGKVPGASLDRQYLSLAYHPSTVSVGTWSFDYMYDGSLDAPELAVNFMSLSQATWVLGSTGECYGVYVGYQRPDKIDLYVDLKYPSAWKLLSITQSPTKPRTWYHIDVTRNDEGRICVYVDGVMKIDEVDSTHSESVFLGVMLEHSWRGDAVIDNIVVSDTIDVEPQERKRTGIPGFPSESVTIGLVVGAVLLLRLQHA
ncbi:MAG: hypothetical protein ACXADB_13300 [Candidatus Hermodarchaeia archaeon]|jgi:hypothetical protein